MTTDSVLEVCNLNIHCPNFKGSCGKQQGLPLLASVNLELKRGKVLGLVGESGSGKSLTCGAILQMLQDRGLDTQGSIKLHGQELNGLRGEKMRRIRGKDIGYIMQNPMNAFTPVYSIGSQFIETLRSHFKISKKEAKMQAHQALEEMNLRDPAQVMKSYPHELSGGMLQRVMIAISMCLRPSILIADEPTTALDAVNQIKVLRELERLKTECGTSVLLVSHDLGVIAQAADEVAVMRKGEIVEYADVHELFDNPRHEYTQMLLQARPRIGQEA